MLHVPLDIINKISSFLSNKERISFSSTNKYLRKVIKKRFMRVNDIVYRKNDMRNIWTTYGIITAINRNNVHIRLLDISTDGYGNMWPIVDENIIKTNIRKPRGQRERVYDIEVFKANWLPHISCQEHSGEFENTYCICVFDDIVEGRHVPKYKKRRKLS